MKRIWVVVLLSFGLATSAAAQRTTGQIIGKVVDESGSVLPGVTVTLRGAGVAGAPSVVTSDTGVYRFPVLPPGDYTVEYALSGFSTVKRERIPVDVGAVVELDITLKVGSLEETVTVSGASPVVDLASSEVSTSYNREWVQNAPVRRFSYFDLINSAPGVSATSNVGQSTAAQSLGNSVNDNSYLQTDGLTGRNTTDAQDGGRPYHRDTWHDATVQASGPFIKDKLWFFGSVQYQKDWDSQPGVDPNTPTENDTRRVFWKFNWQITPKHSLMHGYHDDYYFIPDIATSFTAPSTIYLNHGDNPTPNLVYTGVLSDKTFIEARYSGFYLHASQDPQDGSARVQPRFEDQDTGQITGGITNWFEQRSWRYGYQTKLSHLVDNFAGGSHDYKIGLQYTGHGSDQVNGPNDLFLTYSVTRRPTTGSTQLPYHQGALAHAFGTYFDDTYRLGRATINMGVRYDYSKGLFQELPFLDAQGSPTGQFSAANDDVYDWSEFSPRVGINYKVNDSGKTVVKAHYGRYYKALEAVEFRVAVPSITTQFNFTVDANGNRTNVSPVLAANLRIDPDFKSAYSDQYIAQFEQQLTTDL